jgi:hypothetical protein
MHDNLRELFPDNFSDETAHQLVNFFYELALAFESIHLGKVMRYQKSLIQSKDDLVNQIGSQRAQKEEELQEPPF